MRMTVSLSGDNDGRTDTLLLAGCGGERRCRGRGANSKIREC